MAEIEKEFGITPDLIEGSSGIYDVVVDGDMIFSKDRVGRFPEDGEICREVRARG